jgi:hypothetical protein
MFNRRNEAANRYEPIVIRWETSVAEFLRIEISPSHIYILRVDKKLDQKGGHIR